MDTIDFNKHDINIFINETCRKYQKDIICLNFNLRYESSRSCRIGMENTSLRITFLHLKREADSTDICRFTYTYKCSNHGSKAVNRHIDYTHVHFYKFYSSETIFTSFNSKNFTRPIGLLVFHDHQPKVIFTRLRHQDSG